MSDENRQSPTPPQTDPIPLAYHGPEARMRRPVAGALAILSACVCGFIGIGFSGAGITAAGNGNLLGGGMSVFYGIAFLMASTTLGRTAIRLIRGTQPENGQA